MPSMLSLLLPSLAFQGIFCANLLMEALERADIVAAKSLLNDYKTDYGFLCRHKPDMLYKYAHTPLLMCLHKDPPIPDIALELIRSDVDLHPQTEKEGETALHLAVRKHLRLVVNAILRHRRDPNLLELKNAEGHTALHTALMVNTVGCGDSEAILQALLIAGANIEAEVESMRPLHYAAMKADAFAIESLLSKGANVNGTDGANENGAVRPKPMRLLLDLKVEGDGETDRFLKKDCVVAFINYGMQLTNDVAVEIFRRFWPSVYKSRKEDSYDCFDEYFVGLSKAAEMIRDERKLQNLADLYDDEGMFALYRILRQYSGRKFQPMMKMWARFSRSASASASKLEQRQKDIFQHLCQFIPPKTSVGYNKWAIQRISWNVALASFLLKTDVEPTLAVANNMMLLL